MDVRNRTVREKKRFEKLSDQQQRLVATEIEPLLGRRLAVEDFDNLMSGPPNEVNIDPYSFLGRELERVADEKLNRRPDGRRRSYEAGPPPEAF